MLQEVIPGRSGKPAAIEDYIGVANYFHYSKPYGIRHSFLFMLPRLTKMSHLSTLNENHIELL